MFKKNQTVRKLVSAMLDKKIEDAQAVHDAKIIELEEQKALAEQAHLEEIVKSIVG